MIRLILNWLIEREKTIATISNSVQIIGGVSAAVVAVAGAVFYFQDSLSRYFNPDELSPKTVKEAGAPTAPLPQPPTSSGVIQLDALSAEMLREKVDRWFSSLNKPGGKNPFPDIPPWLYGYAFHSIAKGDSDGNVAVFWRNCLDQKQWHRICDQTPEYRRTHPIRARNYRG